MTSWKCDVHFSTTWLRSWLRYYTASHKVVGLSPDDVFEFIFNLLNPSSRTTALGLIQPLIEMSTRKYFWGVKRGRRVKLSNSPPSEGRLIVWTMWDPRHSQPYRPPLPVKGIALRYGDGLYFLWGTNWTISTATSSQYLAVDDRIKVPHVNKIRMLFRAII
jgi:hypothetical protein